MEFLREGRNLYLKDQLMFPSFFLFIQYKHLGFSFEPELEVHFFTVLQH